MIKTFKDKDSERLFKAKELKDVPQQFRHIACQVWRKLDILDAVPNLKVLEELLSRKNFETLKHERKGQHVIRVNKCLNEEKIIKFTK